MSAPFSCRHRKNPRDCELCAAEAKPTGKSPAKGSGGGRAELDALLAKVSDLARRDPAKAAIIVTSWLNGSARPARSPRKKAA